MSRLFTAFVGPAIVAALVGSDTTGRSNIRALRMEGGVAGGTRLVVRLSFNTRRPGGISSAQVVGLEEGAGRKQSELLDRWIAKRIAEDFHGPNIGHLDQILDRLARERAAEAS